MFIVCNSQDLETSQVPISGWIKSLWCICMYNYQYVAPNFLTALSLDLLFFLSLLLFLFSPIVLLFISLCRSTSLPTDLFPFLLQPYQGSFSVFFFFFQIWLLPFPSFSLSLLCFKISFLFSISVTFSLSTCLSLTPIFPFLFLHLWLLGILPLCFYLSFHFSPWSP